MEKHITKIKAAGYVRVSTPGQVDDESLTTQRKNINEFAASQNYELVKIYADEGISGGSMAERHALSQCLVDGKVGKFKVLIVHRLSRFGRNARELLENHNQLKLAGIQLRSISEGIDFSTKYGEAMLGMLAVIAQLERDIIKETMLENRVAKAQRGVPTSGKYPYGRTFNRETGAWEIDEEKALKIRKAAEEYLGGRPLQEIADELGMTYNNLLKVLGKRSGGDWVVKFKDYDPVVHKIPSLLPEEMIEKVKERLEFNRKNNRVDLPGKYIMTGFIRCDKCLSRLTGVTINYPKSPLRIYKHKRGECMPFKYVHAEPIEDAVFDTIFDNIIDVNAFERAIAGSLPDESKKQVLIDRIRATEKRIERVEKDIDTLVQAVLSGTLTAETIRTKEQELLNQKNGLQTLIDTDRSTLNLMPDSEDVKREAQNIRRSLLERYSGFERLSEMTFDEKRNLLHWLFDGKDPEGTPYGIYITTEGPARRQKIDYFFYGRIIGIKTLSLKINNNHNDE